MTTAKYSILIAGCLGTIGVSLGAFGAHWLPGWLEARSLPESDIVHLCQTFDTGVRYHMYHAIALISVGLLANLHRGKAVSVSLIAFLVGILIFSGALYALVFTGVTVLGAIVPIGGAAFLVGWLALAVAGFQIIRD